MSDDGVYGDYDELEDLLYGDDVSENLADDLAAHTLPSPVFAEDAAYAIMDYPSDWEYSEDDFYDDDPTLMTTPGGTQELSVASRAVRKEVNRGKKRKLVDTKDIPAFSLDERHVTLRDTMRGTVWAKPLPTPRSPYQQGQGERVALLQNWREVFKQSQPRNKLVGRSKGRQRPENDESWAKDLGLEEMGLRSSRESRRGGEAQDEGAADLDEDEDESSQVSLSQDVGDGTNFEVGDGNGDLDSDFTDDNRAKKRPRVVMMPSPPPSNVSPSVYHRDIQMATNAQEKSDISLRLSASGRLDRTSSLDARPDSTATNSLPTLANRKRKIREDDEQREPDSIGNIDGDISSRAKRIASSKIPVRTEMVGGEAPALPTTRTTRGRKK